MKCDHFALFLFGGFRPIGIFANFRQAKFEKMEMNLIALLGATIVPLLVGAVYYGPVLGKAWMNVNGFTEDDLKGANMAVIFGLSLLFSFLIALSMTTIVIHQMGIMQILQPLADAGSSEAQTTLDSFMENYSGYHRSLGHGALHGAILSLLFAFPLVAINALFERRGWKYIGIHTGYWFIVLTIMGAIICKFL